jgi:hypothetical protein
VTRVGRSLRWKGLVRLASNLGQSIGNICLLKSDIQQRLATVLRFPIYDSGPFVERDGHFFVRGLLACQVSPPVLPEVFLDIQCSIAYMVPRWQVKGISQLFQRPSFRLRHKQVHEEEGKYIQARENAECARVADTVEEKREDENKHPRTKQIDRYTNRHTHFARYQRKDLG